MERFTLCRLINSDLLKPVTNNLRTRNHHLLVLNHNRATNEGHVLELMSNPDLGHGQSLTLRSGDATGWRTEHMKIDNQTIWWISGSRCRWIVWQLVANHNLYPKFGEQALASVIGFGLLKPTEIDNILLCGHRLKLEANKLGITGIVNSLFVLVRR